MSATPNPIISQTIDAMMRLVRSSLGPDAVAKLQAAAKSPAKSPAGATAGPSGGKEVPGAAQPAEKPTETSSAKPANLPVNDSPTVPPELIAAILTAEIEGDHVAVNDLVKLGQDPEGLGEFVGDTESGTAGLMGSRAFSRFARTFSAGHVQTFGWFSDPSPRSKSRVSNENGDHLYGERARKALEWQGREDRGESHPQTPKDALIAHKQAQEPKREEARAAYQAALKDPGSVRPEQLASLAEHLHTLTRDEVRANLRTLEKATGGKLKHDLVDALLSHVRESAIAHHETKLDPLGMGLDQDEATRRIQALEETRPGAKKTPLQQTQDEKTTHADRMQQRQDAERAGVQVDKNAAANHPADHVPSTPDKPNANPKSENVLTEHLNRKVGGDAPSGSELHPVPVVSGSGAVGGDEVVRSGSDPARNGNAGDAPAAEGTTPAEQGKPGATGPARPARPDAVAGGVADAASAHAAADEYAKEAKRIANSLGGNPDAAIAHGEAANALRNVAKTHEAIDAENARHAEPAKRVDAANAKVGELDAAATAAREREAAAKSKTEGLRAGGDPKDKIANLKEKLAASKAKGGPQAVQAKRDEPQAAGGAGQAASVTVSLKNVLHKLRGLDVQPGEVEGELKKLDGMSAPDLLAVARDLNMDATLSDKTPANKIRKQIKEQVNAVHKIAVQAPENIERKTPEERLAQHRKEMGYIPESGNIPPAGDKSSVANQETPVAIPDTHIGGVLRDQQERAAVAKKLGVSGKLSPSEANVHFEGVNQGPMPAEAVKRRLEKYGIVGAEADKLLAGVKPSGEQRKAGTRKMVPNWRGSDVMRALGLVEDE